MQIHCRYGIVACAFGALFIADVGPALGAEIEEVIVTARKREESLQDVPVAIQAFDTEQINRYAATNLNEIADLATQVQVYPGSSGNGANIVIRGLGSTSLDPGIEASVGINLDGVQTDRGHIVRQAFFDLASVEVLKGPQALFFGKNSPAGVIAATSARPGAEFEARVHVGYEFESDEKIGELVLSGPVSDTLGIRLAYRGSDSDGFIDNTAGFLENSNGEFLPSEPFDFPGGAGDLGAEESHAVRLTFDWAPTDTFEAVLRTMYTDFQTDGYQTPEVNSCTLPNQPVTGFGALLDPFADCEVNGKASHGSLPREVAAAFTFDVGNGDPFGEYESFLGSLQLEWDLGQYQLSSVTGYYDYDYVRFDNFDGTVFNQLLGIQIEDQQTFSQEIRLLSQFPGPVNFMIGGFYETFERDSDNAGKIFPLGFDPVTGFSNTWAGISTVESDTFSLFGQLIWDITDQIELAAGARYTDDDKKATQQNIFVHAFAPPIFVLPGNELLSDFDDTVVSPEVTLSWRPNDTTTLYAAYRTGYKSGGFSTNTVIAAGSTGESLTFQPEESEGFEAGYKSTLLDGRMRFNVTAYYYEFDDLQVSAFNADTTSFTINNAASAETLGVDVEIQYLATDGLTLRGAWGYNQGEYKDFTTSACWQGQTVADGCVNNLQDLSGEDLARAPRHSGSFGFDFFQPFGGNLAFTLSAEANFTDDYQTNTTNDPLSIQDSFWRINARVGIGAADGRWDVMVVGRNLGNERYQGGQANKPGGIPGGQDLFGGVVRARQVILQATYNLGG